MSGSGRLRYQRRVPVALPRLLPLLDSVRAGAEHDRVGHERDHVRSADRPVDLPEEKQSRLDLARRRTGARRRRRPQASRRAGSSAGSSTGPPSCSEQPIAKTRGRGHNAQHPLCDVTLIQVLDAYRTEGFAFAAGQARNAPTDRRRDAPPHRRGPWLRPAAAQPFAPGPGSRRTGAPGTRDPHR